MFINPEAALSPRRALILSGRPIRIILGLPADALNDDAPAAPEGVDALAIRCGTVEDTTAVRLIRKARNTAPSLPLLVIVDGAGNADETDARLSTLAPARPDGLILTGMRHGADLQRFDVQLTVAEAAAGLEPGATALIAMIGDNPDGLIDAGSFAGRTQRLKAIGYDMAGLAERLGIGRDKDMLELPAALTLGRGTSVLAAARAGVAALERVDPGLKDERLASACRRAVGDGFSVLLCEEPRQVPVIAGLYR